MVTGHCCESVTHRLTAVGAVTCDHKITTHNKLYKLQHDITLCNMLAYLCLCFPKWWCTVVAVRGAKRGMRPGRHCAGAAFGGARYGILKFGCCWQIGICIADSDVFTPLTLQHFSSFGTTALNCQWFTAPHKVMYTPKKLHCWVDCCKFLVDPYCPVTVLLAIAVQCFALFTCFQILHKIWKFFMKFGHFILRKICKFVGTRSQILRLKCIKFDCGWGSTPDPATGAYSAPPDILVAFRGLLLSLIHISEPTRPY